MYSIVSDTSKFKPMTLQIEKYTQKIEDKISNFQRKLRPLDLITEEIYKRLFISGSGPGILYGKPKIHKPDFSRKIESRPIFTVY